MVMDSPFSGYYGPMNGINDETLSILSSQNPVNGFEPGDNFFDQRLVDVPPLLPDPGLSNLAPLSCESLEGDPHEDCDFNDVVLKYINQMLMEEDMEEQACMFQESAALQAAEKSFYEVIGEKCPPSSSHCPSSSVDQNIENPDESYPGIYNYCNSSCSNFVNPAWNCGFDTCPHTASEFSSQSSLSLSNRGSNITDGFVDSLVQTLGVPDMFSESDSVMKFGIGVEKASKFLINDDIPFVDLENNGLVPQEHEVEDEAVVIGVEKKVESESFVDGLSGNKNHHPKDVDLEVQRSNKQSAVYTDMTVRSEMFDMVLLCDAEKSESALREALHSGSKKNVHQNGKSKRSNGGKSRGKKQGGKRNVVDLRNLLTLCAQAVAAGDRRNANELLKQIRQHSSPMGDGIQRMAHYFANGLEARLAGSGTQIYNAFLNRYSPAADCLKAYHLFLAVCPFMKLSIFFANKTIMHVAEKATRLHIIDFGILYGFQWPRLIQRLSSRPGGPPKLRITGIDLPQPGFRPTARVEETGCRLAYYAETFNVPFEFNAIAQKWETIQIEDLKIQDGEVLAVNSMYRFRNLLDETVIEESPPRDIVLNLIRKMNPDVFVQGIVNGAHSSPFFIGRFREALFHYYTLFDMLDTNVPHEVEERMMLEKEIFGRGAMNVIACEGAERIERPETYKQCQVRNLRAGFRQLPLNQEIMKMAKDRVKSCYHKYFMIDEVGQWMLQGWKGRITYAISSWRPAY
ncbi:hypothetical protein L1049_012188 [Liquidambar formosana]|uniref:Uncharacterized protein n=1 Tax=Liquidambar formosana TaxID=63359 RepID=A0AAP0X0D0_LIQFO